MKMRKQHAMLMTDFYKLGHADQYPVGTTKVYSTWTPRQSRIADITEVVAIGGQGLVKEVIRDFFDQNFFFRDLEEVKAEFIRVVKHTLGIPNPNFDRMEALHKLGYLPLRIRALPEGTKVPIRCPASIHLWPMSTSATIADKYRKLFEKYAIETVGNADFVPFQGHDFSMRGMSSLETAARSGFGHLTSFVGTDTIPAIEYAEAYYGADVTKELVGTSIYATEHSVMCAYQDDELSFKRLITEVYPSGFISIVSDTWDLWDVVDRILPMYKDIIMKREGKVVIRPDSGDPVKIMTGDDMAPANSPQGKGVIECLWDIFGGTVSDRGYKVLDSHIGSIYGDSITPERAQEICARLMSKGFASINMVYGIGSYTYQYVTRDTFGYALKSTLVVINGQEINIFKNPKTDDGVKKSQTGRVAVFKGVDGKLFYKDGLSLATHCPGNLLQDIYVNGAIYNEQTLADIRAQIRK
jgi:nicotinamide phosphoribosyltransferase